MAIGKVLWGVVSGEGTGWAMLIPAMEGLLVCDAVVLYAARRIRTRSSRHGQPTSVAATRDPVRDPEGAIRASEQRRSHG